MARGRPILVLSARDVPRVPRPLLCKLYLSLSRHYVDCPREPYAIILFQFQLPSNL